MVICKSYWNRLKSILLSIVYLHVVILFFPSASYETDIPFREYLNHKGLCNYERAIDVIEEWTVDLDDPVIIETNLFRIDELLEYPELFVKGNRAFSRILKSNRVVKEHPFLRSRIELFLNDLLLRQGKRKDAVRLRDSLGFLKEFKLVGPFGNGGAQEFDTSYPPEAGFNRDAVYQGKIYQVKWFDAFVDLSGKIDIENLFSGVSDSLFYLESELNIPSEGNYVLSLGKTGFIDIWLDGTRVFSNRKRHSFSFDQYRLNVFLSEGRHKILIKAGESLSDGINLALRVTDEKGNAVNADDNHDRAHSNISRLLGTSYFNSLERITKAESADERNAFIAGYLFYISGLNSEKDREALRLFNDAMKTGESVSPSSYYMGLIEGDEVKKDFHFYESVKANKRNIEALSEIAEIKIRNRFIYEASPIVESIREISPLSPVYLALKAELFLSLGWHEEAMKTASLLKKSDYPSNGYFLEARIKRLSKRYKEALEGYRFLYESDRFSIEHVEDVIECYEALGQYKDIEKILNRAVVMFPNNVWVRLKLSEVIGNNDNLRASLPYLASAMRLSPYNKQVLFETGILYHKLGKDKLALHYLRKALRYDPNNFELKRFLRIISNEKNELEKYLVKDDPTQLAVRASKYRNEPAVFLLKEVAFRVLSDGSYEKWVHKIIKINDQNAIKDFARQYVVIDPNTDRLENMKCAVINDGERIETSKVSKRSLSDPESRLYYDLLANIISVPSIRKGSIVDLSYVVKSREGEILKNYFGEKVSAGSEYRTILSNILISFPNEKRIYYHLNGIKKKSFSVIPNSGKKIYRILLSDIPPYKNEPAMPHSSEILPCVYFSSHKDWNELHRWYLTLVKDRINMSVEMKTSVDAIIKKDDSDLEKVRKIYNHVNKAIRYVGFEFGVGGIQPRRSDLTYHTKMGDCKDITFVLIAMLREVGIDARMALVRVREMGKANLSVPFLGEFNHAICYVNLGNGFFIDGTAKMSGFRELPDDDRGIKAMVLDDRGFRFMSTESRIYDENLETAITDVNVHESGKALLKRTISRKGSLSAMSRYATLNKDRWSQRISEYWNSRFTGSKIQNLKVVEMGVEGPVSYKYNIEIPSFVSAGGEEIIFSSFLVPSGYYRDYTMLKKRRFPLVLSKIWKAHVKIKYRIPDGFSIYRIPKNEEYKNKKYSASFRFVKSKNNKTIEVESTVRFKDFRLEVDEYKEFRNFTRFIDRKENEKIVLVKLKSD